MLCSSGTTTLRKEVDVSGPGLTEEEVKMLQEYGRGEEAPGSTDLFPELGFVPHLNEVSGPSLSGTDCKLVDLHTAKGETVYVQCVKTLNKSKVTGRADTVWRQKLDVDTCVKPARQPPPPPPTSPSPGGVANSPQSPPPASREPITQRLNDLMSSGSRTRKQCLRSLKRGLSLKLGSGPADCSHLPPEQRRKKLQTRINNMNEEIQREREQRDALLKMREVYERNPQMGDAGSLEPRLEEVKQSLQRLEEELRRNQAWLSEADSKACDLSSRRQSGGCGLNSQVDTPGSSSLKQLEDRSPASRESPDGSYTEDHSAELQFKSRSSEFDDDFEDEEPLPSIGTCKSLYPFQGQNEGTLSMVEGELLSVVEEDKGDGWTRVRRNLEEEGYVPTSYIKVFLDSSAKGAMTYI
ncbi:formin-binding protein 1-like [Anarrhichthys ocellatus]|uniref:formin-binding protein 1-like n=1 Tax=Anarrhichthys ocellatus TaxID=433405 RepID=UPI0012ED279E|nr:formin-binding protein 1-like [Anarrhichthys ocellatus]